MNASRGRTRGSTVQANGVLKSINEAGTMAIAAAEVVAALLGNPYPDLPDEVANWVDGKSLAADSALVEAARKAIDAVQDAETSELAQLWSDDPESLAAWRNSLADLANRLR